MKHLFSPSLMCMDLTKFNEQITILNSRADMYHVDIMDGHFVKNITLSPFFISQLRTVTALPIDAHLMVEKPEDFIDMTAEAGADYISVHAETINRAAFRLIHKIKDHGAKVGIVLNPATPLEWISPYVHLIDKLTIMTVDPGFAGQPFIAEMTKKSGRPKNGEKQIIIRMPLRLTAPVMKKPSARLQKLGMTFLSSAIQASLTSMKTQKSHGIK